MSGEGGRERLGRLLRAVVAHFPAYSAGKWRLADPDGTQLWDPTPSTEPTLGGAPVGPLCANTKRAAEDLLYRLRIEAFEALPAPSPSIPDPSDEREVVIEWLRGLAQSERICAASTPLPSDAEQAEADARRFDYAADLITAAARPTSLPEAPESDEVDR